MSVRTQVIGTVALVVAIVCAACSSGGGAQAAPAAPPPLPPNLVWVHIGDNNGVHVFTACTPGGDRLYMATGGYGGYSPAIAVVGANTGPCVRGAASP